MPYIEGESLRDRLQRERPLDPEEALRIAREAARGLQYAHEHGVIHRDVKPENILLTRDGSTLVADFGIARADRRSDSAHLTGRGIVMGTPAYMSPEQATGIADLDARTDMYALGCVLFEMLTGEPPFRGPTVHAVVMKHLTEQPPCRADRRRASRGDPAGAVPRARQGARRSARRARPNSPRHSSDRAEQPLPARCTPPDRGDGGGRPRRRSGRRARASRERVRSHGARRGGGSAGGTVASGFARKLAQLSFGEGLEEWPAWSPDGNLLAYAAEVDGFRQILVRPMAGGAERQLTGGAPRPHPARLVSGR